MPLGEDEVRLVDRREELLSLRNPFHTAHWQPDSAGTLHAAMNAWRERVFALQDRLRRLPLRDALRVLNSTDLPLLSRPVALLDEGVLKAFELQIESLQFGLDGIIGKESAPFEPSTEPTQRAEKGPSADHAPTEGDCSKGYPGPYAFEPDLVLVEQVASVVSGFTHKTYAKEAVSTSKKFRRLHGLSIPKGLSQKLCGIRDSGKTIADICQESGVKDPATMRKLLLPSPEDKFQADTIAKASAYVELVLKSH